MAFKVTFKEKLQGIMDMLQKRDSTAELSFKPKKKFSDVMEYLRAGKLGKSLAGRAVKDIDNGAFAQYDYMFDGRSMSQGGYQVSIWHMGEYIQDFKCKYKATGASWQLKDVLNKMEKKVPDFEIPEGQKIEAKPAVNYSEKTLAELVDAFDKKLKEFKKDSSLGTLNEIATIKDAMDEKVGEKPIAERGAFEKPLANITTYIEALKTQMQSPLINPTQFISMYVPQMSASLAEIAGLL